MQATTDELLHLNVAIYDARVFDRYTEISLADLQIAVWKLAGKLCFKEVEEGRTLQLTEKEVTDRNIELTEIQCSRIAKRIYKHMTDQTLDIVADPPKHVMPRKPKIKYGRQEQKYTGEMTAALRESIENGRFAKFASGDPSVDQCPHCGGIYRSGGFLVKHIRRAHKDETKE